MLVDWLYALLKNISSKVTITVGLGSVSCTPGNITFTYPLLVDNTGADRKLVQIGTELRKMDCRGNP